MSKELLTDDEYGYKYQQNDDGTIIVRYGEIKHMLDEKTKKYGVMIHGHYTDVNDCEDESYINTEFKDLIKKVNIGQTDMFGNVWRLSLQQVKQIIDEVYYENGWDEIYDWEEVEND